MFLHYDMLNLTFVENLEAAVWSAVVGGEQQIQEVAAAEEELRHLGSIKRSNQRREQVGTVVHLQEVVAELRLKPLKSTKSKRKQTVISIGKVCLCAWQIGSLRASSPAEKTD